METDPVFGINKDGLKRKFQPSFRRRDHHRVKFPGRFRDRRAVPFQEHQGCPYLRGEGENLRSSVSGCDLVRELAALQRRDHRQVDELDIAFVFPEQEHAAFGLDGDMVAMWHPNLASIRQMQSERVRLRGVASE